MTIGGNDIEADRRIGYACWAAWRMPDEELLEEFQEAVREAGVYDLMDQVNLCGTAGGPPGGARGDDRRLSRAPAVTPGAGDRGDIGLDAPLADVGIDVKQPLKPFEEVARVRHQLLMKSAVLVA